MIYRHKTHPQVGYSSIASSTPLFLRVVGVLHLSVRCVYVISFGY